jgi:hypothetical protein
LTPQSSKAAQAQAVNPSAPEPQGKQPSGNATAKKKKVLTEEERLRVKEEGRLYSKLRRLGKSEEVTSFPNIHKLWTGTARDRKGLLEKWLQSGGNADAVECELKVKASLKTGAGELQKKLTIKQMKEQGFSKPHS